MDYPKKYLYFFVSFSFFVAVRTPVLYKEWKLIAVDVSVQVSERYLAN